MIQIASSPREERGVELRYCPLLMTIALAIVVREKELKVYEYICECNKRAAVAVYPPTFAPPVIARSSLVFATMDCDIARFGPLNFKSDRREAGFK